MPMCQKFEYLEHREPMNIGYRKYIYLSANWLLPFFAHTHKCIRPYFSTDFQRMLKVGCDVHLFALSCHIAIISYIHNRNWHSLVPYFCLLWPWVSSENIALHFRSFDFSFLSLFFFQFPFSLFWRFLACFWATGGDPKHLSTRN